MRELSELNAATRQQLQQVQGVTLDRDTALVINMNTDSQRMSLQQHSAHQDPRMRAQSEWLAREQRKLARAKEQYARDIRELQRKAESSLAKAEKNLQLKGSQSRHRSTALTSHGHDDDLLDEMRQWESNIISALRAFLPSTSSPGRSPGKSPGSSRRERQEVLRHLRRFQSAQRYVP